MVPSYSPTLYNRSNKHAVYLGLQTDCSLDLLFNKIDFMFRCTNGNRWKVYYKLLSDVITYSNPSPNAEITCMKKTPLFLRQRSYGKLCVRETAATVIPSHRKEPRRAFNSSNRSHVMTVAPRATGEPRGLTFFNNITTFQTKYNTFVLLLV
jgi:hypothetical protein